MNNNNNNCYYTAESPFEKALLRGEGDLLFEVLEFTGKMTKLHAISTTNKRVHELMVGWELGTESYRYGWIQEKDFEKYYSEFRKNTSWLRSIRKKHEKIAEGIVLYNNEGLLRWALDRKGNNHHMICDICEYVASKGRVKTLDVILNHGSLHGHEQAENSNELVNLIYVTAVRTGQVNVLDFLEEKVPSILGVARGFVFNEAVEHGQIDVLRWFIKRGVMYNEYSLVRALEFKQWEAARFLLNEGCKESHECPFQWTSFFCNNEMKELLKDHGFQKRYGSPW
eukprot:CAMPEP_0178972680 /NCGR_PEP_ID=MMETSP0789-20121207/21190_1 /TAXON_ID=3005 /ORGANISM="Rhizosolenia setigera, Strain CCMP 1694" /LENGTH=282 /DNA_ID=CAMNT_0020660239 /DNA_START=70 /DNA_END=915 /DNA_ORIENTATION=-